MLEISRGDVAAKARSQRTHQRPCRFCPATAEDDVQALALHLLLTCKRAPKEARAVALDTLRRLRDAAVAQSVERAAAGGETKKGQEMAAAQVRAAWHENLGPEVAALLTRSDG